MGKNVLKYHGVVPGSPTSVIFQVTLLAVIFVSAMSTIKTEDLRLRILKGLDMTRRPHLSQFQPNISQTEFETKHKEYFALIERNQRRRLNSIFNYDDENIVRKKLYRFTHSGLEISRPNSKELGILNYNLNIPEQSNSYVEIDETSIRLLIVPTNCCRSEEQQVILEALSVPGGTILGSGTFKIDSHHPRWVSLDLAGSIPKKGQLALVIQPDESSRGRVKLEEPYLNVIVNVKSKRRRKRAKKSGKTSKNCEKIPLEVTFANIPGYQFIIQPKTMNIGLCTGRCPVRWRMSQHAILQRLVSDKDGNVPKPCCSPWKMKGMEYLYVNEYDSTKLKVGFWDDTIVEECRCS